ncbi:thiol reductant ABC exporter subunit CydC [Metabacillus herbersteinensis]|uniref:Thiol reductant ABC exporter subunit CydC n=1 Tax=Metabacillus herbersteinensis TaxID=283816 RepID=A0ABV6GHD3_9BACI
MRVLGPVLKLMMNEKKDVFYSILFGFLAGISAVGLFASSGYIISKAALATPLYALTVLIALLKLIGFARALSRYAERYFSHRATFTILSNLRVSFYEKLEPLAPRIYTKYRSGDLLARIVGDVESLQNFFLRVYYPPIVLVIVFLSTIVFTSFYSIYVALILLTGLILTGFVVPAFFAVRQKKIDSTVREGRGALSIEVTELLYGFRDLKIYQKLEEKERLLTASSNAYIQEQEREGIQAIFNQSLNTMVSLIISWFVLTLGSYLVVQNQFDGLFLAMLVMISLTVFENATPMAVLPYHLEDSRQAASRLYAVVEDKKKNDDLEPTFRLLPQQALSFDVEDVTFAFPEEKRLALDKLNLRIPSGTKTAIVGPSGSGKSTLLQLLLKVHEGYQGKISIDGHSIDGITQEDLWNKTNVVLQENHFFYGTIRENLLLSKDELSDAEMNDMLEKVKLSHFSLSDLVLEKGENLSGGEKQRLAIARAMLKDERVWLLDEPTSSIDALTEKEIYDQLFQQAKDDTLILVSHRLTGLEKVDQILVMENGTIIESGTFNELMDMKGYFYELKQIEKSIMV